MGIFDDSEHLQNSVSSIELINFQKPAYLDSYAQFENDKIHRTSYLFELLKYQDEGKEIIIASGADAERKRIEDLIKEESSLQRLAPRYLPIGLRTGFIAEPDDSQKYFQLFAQDPKKAYFLPRREKYSEGKEAEGLLGPKRLSFREKKLIRHLISQNS